MPYYFYLLFNCSANRAKFCDSFYRNVCNNYLRTKTYSGIKEKNNYLGNYLVDKFV
jgi:hypothetical protein